MTSPTLSETVNPLRALMGKRIEKDVKFMGAKVRIAKLTVEEAQSIQKAAEAVSKDDDADDFDILRDIICTGMEGVSDLSTDEFRKFPLEELTKLSNEIMSYSGLTEGK